MNYLILIITVISFIGAIGFLIYSSTKEEEINIKN